MKSFKYFLLENQVYNPIPEIPSEYKETIEFLKRNTTPIFRGMRGKINKEIYFGNGDLIQRVSANTNNLYTLLTSQYLPKWKKYPRRDKSFICSTDNSYTTNYGIVYRVYPLENQNIEICPEQDWWESFNNTLIEYFAGFDYLEIINYFIQELVNYNNPRAKNIKWLEDINLFMKEINDLQKRIEQNPDKYKNYINYLTNVFNENKLQNILTGEETILEMIENILDPDLNDFEIQKANEFNLGQNIEREVWMTGKVLFVL